MKISDIPAVNRILKKEYETHNAPVVDLIKAKTENPFNILVATILSARTKDETTADVCDRLFKVVKRPGDFARLTVKELEKLIFPIGFYHTKARHLKQLPVALTELFAGRIPDEIDDLVKLPGVGRKTANLVLAQGFNKPAICVDVHVHRICNRLGLLRTRNPFETEMRLRKILPVKYWITWNSYLVSYGQTVCRPVGPRCGVCPIFKYCKRVGVKARA
jgi:endonuclease III